MFTTKKFFWSFGIVVSVLLVVWLLTIIPMKPDGQFRNDGIACVGTAFWEFKDGMALLKVPKDGKHDYQVDNIGIYTNQNNQWVCITKGGHTFQLETTLLSIRFIDPSQKTPKYPRLFIDP